MMSPSPHDTAADVESAATAVTRLDTRLAMSPLKEAWQVRACVKAAVSLATVDGTPVREADVVAMMSGAKLPVPSSLRPTGTALAWWRAAMGRNALSEPSARLVGRSVTPARRAFEVQVEWDDEDARPAARRVAANGDPGEDHDAWSRRGAELSLNAMRAEGDGLVAAARGLRAAVLTDRDRGRVTRRWELAEEIRRQALERSDGTDGARAAISEMLDSLDWEGPSAIGEAHLVVPDRLMEIGWSQRLSIVTGATKRMGSEHRADDRAIAGFLRTVAREAREGLALLETLEATVARWSKAIAPDSRSSLPTVLWAFLVLPAVDVDWIVEATGLDQRVVQKFVKRLSDASLITHWSERRTEGVDARASDVRLWMIVGFDRDLDLGVRRRRAWKPPAGMDGLFTDTLDRHRDVDVSLPMAEVFARFDAEMADVDREFGSLWPERVKRGRV